MSDIRTLIRVAETHAPAPAADLPDVPLYEDPETYQGQEVHSGSKAKGGGWRIDSEDAAEWAMKKMYEAEKIIAREIARHAAERAELVSELRRLDARIEEIVAPQRHRAAFMEAVLLEWMSRARATILAGRAKSRKFLYATLGFRKAPEKLEYEDEKATIAWARQQGVEAGLYRAVLQLEKDALKAYAKAKSITPPGARWVGGGDEPYCTTETPTIANTPDLQLVPKTNGGTP